MRKLAVLSASVVVCGATVPAQAIPSSGREVGVDAQQEIEGISREQFAQLRSHWENACGKKRGTYRSKHDPVTRYRTNVPYSSRELPQEAREPVQCEAHWFSAVQSREKEPRWWQPPPPPAKSADKTAGAYRLSRHDSDEAPALSSGSQGPVNSRPSLCQASHKPDVRRLVARFEHNSSNSEPVWTPASGSRGGRTGGRDEAFADITRAEPATSLAALRKHGAVVSSSTSFPPPLAGQMPHPPASPVPCKKTKNRAESFKADTRLKALPGKTYGHLHHAASFSAARTFHRTAASHNARYPEEVRHIAVLRREDSVRQTKEEAYRAGAAHSLEADDVPVWQQQKYSEESDASFTNAEFGEVNGKWFYSMPWSMKYMDFCCAKEPLLKGTKFSVYKAWYTCEDRKYEVFVRRYPFYPRIRAEDVWKKILQDSDNTAQFCIYSRDPEDYAVYAVFPESACLTLPGNPAVDGVVVARFDIDRILGYGCDGAVVRGTDHNGVSWAIKQCNKEQPIAPSGKLQELDILERLRVSPHGRHPKDNVKKMALQVEEFISGRLWHYLITELLVGREVESLVVKQQVTTPLVISWMTQLLTLLQHMHEDLGIVHRDLKPENLMAIDGTDQLKLIDFGLSTHLDFNDLNQASGTPVCFAPELGECCLRTPLVPYTEKVDIFSAGIILYYMLTGRMPRKEYDEETQEGVQRYIENEVLKPVDLSNFESPLLTGEQTVRARKLLRCMLACNPKERPSARECLEDKFFTLFRQPPMDTRYKDAYNAQLLPCPTRPGFRA